MIPTESELKETNSRIAGALDRVSTEQGAAIVAAAKNVHGNIAYLRDAIGDVEVIDMLGELREKIIQKALCRATVS